jgi:hypothetical protein
MVALGLAATGCGRERPPAAATPVPVDVLADTSASIPLAARPRASVRAAPTPVRPARALGTGPELPEAVPDTALPEAPIPAASDERLKPPILRTAARLKLPANLVREWRSRAFWVELDLRIDGAGRVTDAVWAGGSADTALIRAARDCAMAMGFYPALRAGLPVAVWSRQRLELE